MSREENAFSAFAGAAVGEVRLADCFLAPRIGLCRRRTIPAALKRCQETHRLEAFRLRWHPGVDWTPHIFWDSDVAKVLEGMAYMVRLDPGDAELRASLEELVTLVVSAQQPDGYLNTFFTQCPGAERWSSICFDHELYCAGHLMEAAVAHCEATGTRRFLDCLCRYADYIGRCFGPSEGQIHAGPGHPEVELALCKLARAAEEPAYARLAKYFIDVRGTNHYYAEEKKRFDMFLRYNEHYNQSYAPVREQQEATGHAVRAVYLLCGMADVARMSGDAGLLAAAIRLFDSIANQKMYLTGAIGSQEQGEAFTRRYNLPDDVNYGESCAAMGLVLLAWRLANATGQARFADVMEQVLYNAALSGLGLSGDEFFYANPMELLEPDRTVICRAYRTVREPWFECSCCPTSFCRFLPQVGRFAWSRSADGAALLIPAAGMASLGGLEFIVEGGYPYDGDIDVIARTAGEYALRLRIPWWCRQWSVAVNGGAVQVPFQDGFAVVHRRWTSGDRVALTLAMPVEAVHASPHLSNQAGKCALMRGPLVYALEEVDNGAELPRLHVNPAGPFQVVPAPDFPEGTVAIRGRAVLREVPSGRLYFNGPVVETPRDFLAVPYALWQNRRPGMMRVWS